MRSRYLEAADRALARLREAAGVGGNASVRSPELPDISQEDAEIIGHWRAADGAAEIVLTATPALAAVKTRLVPRRNTCPQTAKQCGGCLAWRPARLVLLDRARIHLCADCWGRT